MKLWARSQRTAPSGWILALGGNPMAREHLVLIAVLAFALLLAAADLAHFG